MKPPCAAAAPRCSPEPRSEPPGLPTKPREGRGPQSPVPSQRASSRGGAQSAELGPGRLFHRWGATPTPARNAKDRIDSSEIKNGVEVTGRMETSGGQNRDPKEQTVETSQKGEGKDIEVKNVKWKLTKMEAGSTSANIQVMGIVDKGK